ncbi:MAG: F0F1 ATP synthase subunit delta [Metamycoplasmataceae bacterium]
MHSSEKSTGYAMALFSLAKEENKMELFFNEISIISDAISHNNELLNILSSLKINFKEKEKIIKTIFKDTNFLIINFLLIICEKKLIFKLDNILNLFLKYSSDTLNIKNGIIFSSSMLSSQRIRKLENNLSLKMNSKIKLKNIIDKELISGIKIKIENTIIENSIRSELEQIKQELKGA